MYPKPSAIRAFRSVVVASALVAGAVTAVAAMRPAKSGLTLAAESRTMIWNGVAVAGKRVFVAGPRWTGSKGPPVALIRGSRLIAYPDARWNGWTPDGDAARRFVNVNAIHLSGGSLWVVDTGSPEFGGDPLPHGAKLVRIDLSTDKVARIYRFPDGIVKRGSYVDDVRFHGRRAYLTDAGQPGIIVLDLDSGAARRVLDGHPSVTAREGRDIVVSRHVVRTADGKPLHVNADPLEVSPDGRWLYFAPLEGPWSRIETRYLDDPALRPDALAGHVEPWADLPPTGGTVMDADGSLIFTDLGANAVRRRAPDGRITTIVQDDRLHWVDAPFLDAQRRLWLPVPQMDRSPQFADPDRPREWPVQLFYVELRK